MNKHIEALAVQAGMEDYPVSGTQTLYGEDEIEAFAELLIRDCVNSIFLEARNTDGDTAPNVFAKDLIIKLTERYMAN